MNQELADRWRERLPELQARLEDAPGDLAAWHWRAEVRVLRFLISRYGQPAAEKSAQPRVEVCIEPALDEPTLLHMSALQRALMKMALLSPRVQTKHPRPTQRDRAAILERLKEAGDEARDISDAEERWLKQFDLANHLARGAQRNAAQRRDREREWMRRCRDRAEERKRVRRARAWEERERKRGG